MAKMISDEVFERLHHSVNMLHSLQNCHDTIIMKREEVDEKLFEEVNKCGEFVKHFEAVFLQIVNDDMRAISEAAVMNPDSREYAEELIDDINSLIEKFNQMESEYIKRSESLRNTASRYISELTMIKKQMSEKIRQKQKHRKLLNMELSEEFGHTTAN